MVVSISADDFSNLCREFYGDNFSLAWEPNDSEYDDREPDLYGWKHALKSAYVSRDFNGVPGKISVYNDALGQTEFIDLLHKRLGGEVEAKGIWRILCSGAPFSEKNGFPTVGDVGFALH